MAKEWKINNAWMKTLFILACISGAWTALSLIGLIIIIITAMII